MEVEDDSAPALMPALVPVPALVLRAMPRAVGEPDARAVAVAEAEAEAEAERWADSCAGLVRVMSADEPGKPPAYSRESICSHARTCKGTATRMTSDVNDKISREAIQ